MLFAEEGLYYMAKNIMKIGNKELNLFFLVYKGKKGYTAQYLRN